MGNENEIGGRSEYTDSSEQGGFVELWTHCPELFISDQLHSFVIAGHLLGAAGLGALSVGFFAYLLLLNLLRALVTEPVIAVSSVRTLDERSASSRHALSLTIAAVVPACVSMAVVGIVLSGQVGRGILLFAPWLAPALLQDLGRSLVFRDRDGGSVALSDVAWLLTMIVLTPLAVRDGSDWAVVGCWGAGSVVGAAVALRQGVATPSLPGIALAWWRREIWPFARWLGAQATLFAAISFLTTLLLVAVLGTYDYGGLVAVQTVLTPLTLLGVAIALPGLPFLSRIIHVSRRHALGVAAKLGGIITLLTAVYLLVLLTLPGTLSVLFWTAVQRVSLDRRTNRSRPGSRCTRDRIPPFPQGGQGWARSRDDRNAPCSPLSCTFGQLWSPLWGSDGVAWANVVTSVIAGAVLLAIIATKLREN